MVGVISWQLGNRGDRGGVVAMHGSNRQQTRMVVQQWVQEVQAKAAATTAATTRAEREPGLNPS